MSKQVSLCGVCVKEGRSTHAKYRCPACSAMSCSLACVKIHKQDTMRDFKLCIELTTSLSEMEKNCTGLRDRAAPVRKADYNETAFASDFTFLQDTHRVVESAARIRRDPVPRITTRGGHPVIIPVVSRGRMTSLVKEAAKRNINLRFMPRGFARHSRNSSYVKTIPETSETARRRDKREKAMFWHLDVYFTSCHEKIKGTKLIKVDSCEEEQCIGAILKGAMDVLRKGKKRRRSDWVSCACKANDGYKKYLDASEDDLVVFLRNEHVSPTAPPSPPISANAITRPEASDVCRHVQIETHQSLRQALYGRSIVEFPVLHVAFKNSRQAKELASETSGLFEKPDESDGHESESESESESEDEEEKDEHGVEPESPLPKTGIAEEDAQGRNNAELVDAQNDGEPPIKTRKLEGSSDPRPPSVNIEKKGAGKKKNDVEKMTDGVVLPPPTFPVPQEKETSNPQGADSSSSDGDIPDSSHTKDHKMNKSSGRDMTFTRGKEQSTKGNEKKLGGSPDIGSPATDSCATDLLERRGAGVHMDHPFMKESVKAILETRIPRKRKVDGSTPCDPDSKEPRTSTNLSASGW